MTDFSVILKNLTLKERLGIIYKCLFKKEMCLKLPHNFNATDMLPDYVKQNFCNSCEHRIKMCNYELKTDKYKLKMPKGKKKRVSKK